MAHLQRYSGVVGEPFSLTIMIIQNLTINKDGRIFLQLPGKDYKATRCIAIMQDNETLVVEREPSKHFYRNLNAYGFNYELIKRGTFKILCVSLPFGEKLFTTKNTILAKGQYLNFQKNKLEKQIFLPLKEFCRTREEALQQEAVFGIEQQAKSNLQKAKEQQYGLFGSVV